MDDHAALGNRPMTGTAGPAFHPRFGFTIPGGDAYLARQRVGRFVSTSDRRVMEIPCRATPEPATWRGDYKFWLGADDAPSYSFWLGAGA